MIEDRRGDRLRQARRSGVQRRARPGGGPRRLDLRRRNPHETRRQASSALAARPKAGPRNTAVYWPWSHGPGFAPCPHRPVRAGRERIRRRVGGACRLRAPTAIYDSGREAAGRAGSARDARHLLRRVPQPAAQDRRPHARHGRCGIAAHQSGSVREGDRATARRIDASRGTAAAGRGDGAIDRRVDRSRTSIARGRHRRTRDGSARCIA